MRFKKTLAGVLGFALLAACMTGCNQGGAEGDHSAPVIEVAQTVVEKDTTLPEMVTDTSEDENGKLNFSGFCDMDYSKVVSYSRSYAKDGTADEIIVVCVNRESDVNEAMKALKAYVEKRTGTMREYMPQEVEKLDNSMLCYSGCYVGLFISSKAGLDKQNFLEELKKYGIQ